MLIYLLIYCCCLLLSPSVSLCLLLSLSVFVPLSPSVSTCLVSLTVSSLPLLRFASIYHASAAAATAAATEGDQSAPADLSLSLFCLFERDRLRGGERRHFERCLFVVSLQSPGCGGLPVQLLPLQCSSSSSSSSSSSRFNVSFFLLFRLKIIKTNRKIKQEGKEETAASGVSSGCPMGLSFGVCCCTVSCLLHFMFLLYFIL